MIRLLVIVLFLVVYLLLSLPLLLVEAVISLFAPRFRKRRVVFAWVTWAFRTIYTLAGVKLTLLGTERIPADENVLYIGNHQSYFDIVITYGLMRRPTSFVSKKSMRRVPILSWLMIYMNCLFLDRADVRQGMETILAAIDLVNSGIDVCIYPEGTRNHHPDELMDFHKGSFKIAQRTGCPIVPVTITGSRDILENHMPFVRPAQVVLEYGEPFRFSDLPKESQKSIHSYTANLIHETYVKNKNAYFPGKSN